MRKHLESHPFIACYLVALAARLGVAAVAVGIAPDTETYKLAADAFRSSPLTAEASFLAVPPLFPVYLSLIPNDTVALLVQIAAVSLIAPILGIATTRHFGRAAGIVSAILAALEPTLIFWSRFLLTDSFAALFFTTAVAMTSTTLYAGSLHASLAAGVSLGLAWLVRAAYTVTAAVIVLFAALSPHRQVTRGIAAGLGVMLVLAAPMTRNLVAVGEPTVYRSPTWQQIWLGTMWNEVGRGTFGVDLTFPPGFVALSAAEREAFARTEAVRFVTEDPARFAALTFKKVLWFWLPAYPEWSLPHKVFSGGYFLAIYAMAILGLARMRRSVFAWFLCAAVVALVIPVALTLVDYDGRYRLPAEVCLLPLAAAGTELLSKRIRRAMHRHRDAI